MQGKPVATKIQLTILEKHEADLPQVKIGGPESNKSLLFPFILSSAQSCRTVFKNGKYIEEEDDLSLDKQALFLAK